MTDISAFAVGQTVEIQDGRIATVRFVGATHFAPGSWVGIELEDASGKNDGAVQGQRYFDCEPGFGMFIKPDKAEIIAQPPRPNPTRADSGRTNNGAIQKGRPASAIVTGLRRQSVLDASSRRQSINARSPTPSGKGRPRSLVSPSKSPTKQLRSTGGNTGPRPFTSSTAPRVTTGARNRTSVGPRLSISSTPAPGVRPMRPGLGGRAGTNGHMSHPSHSQATSSRRLSIRPGGTRSISHASSSQASEIDGPTSKQEETLLHRALTTQSPDGSPTNESPGMSRSSTPQHPHHPSKPGSRMPSHVTAKPPAVTAKEVDDLKMKLRIIEKKRMDDRDKIKAMEKAKEERDRFENIIQKLQAKYAPQQQEITELRKQIKEAEAQIEALENDQQEHETELEMATLDREMAEETADAIKTELDAFKQKAEELELEVEILREENEELNHEMTPEEKTSQSWLQMERNNERLKEALLRLRDLTQQQESNLRDQIKDLEDDVQELAGVKQQYEMSQEKIAQLESNTEDLRQQLDTALGAEEMIEELTETNLRYQEEIDNLKIAVEDLESLKELNDELEINHVETEKQLQEEIDYKDNVFNEQLRRAIQQDDAIEELEYTLSRFRELVSNLQTDLEDMRASQQITETEASELSSKSRAVMDLNLKLQASASKAQVKTIDMELGRMEAQESSDHLAIVQLFLPEAYDSEKDSVQAYLRFKRIALKSKLIHGLVHERIADNKPQMNDGLFAAYDVLDKLTWILTMCNRFVNYASGCSTEEFAKLAGAFYDLDPVERALNVWIEGLKKDEMKERECADELQRTMSVISDLAEKSITQNIETQADDVHAQSVMMQAYLDNSAAVLVQIKNTVQNKIPFNEEDEEALHFAQNTEQVVSLCRSAKVIASKAARTLEELKSRHLSFKEDKSSYFQDLGEATQELSRFMRTMGDSIFTLFNLESIEGESQTAPTYSSVVSIISSQKSILFHSSEEPSFPLLATKLRNLTTGLSDLANLAADLTQTVEFDRHQAPWVVRAKEIEASKVVAPDIDEELRRLKEDAHEKARTVALRDKALEESTIRIELLESRMRDANTKNEKIHELERKLAEGVKREKNLGDVLDTQAKELQTLEADREKWKKAASEKTGPLLGAIGGDAASAAAREGAQAAMVATAKEIQDLRSEIESLQAAVRFLREDNRRARLPDQGRGQDISWLSEPLQRQKPKHEQQRALLELEAKDAMSALLNLVTAEDKGDETKVAKGLVDLKRFVRDKEDRGKWRPRNQMMGTVVAKQREEWVGWVDWGRGVVGKGREMGILKRGSRFQQPVGKTTLEIGEPVIVDGDEEVRA
ncbi:MAG: hypothetical protein M1834_003146 [Cirrosporium novae-zelandiae]|nr:MAG: hypothetical protein M1834_003146 [Cirrosporium novae-zelandiae]